MFKRLFLIFCSVFSFITIQAKTPCIDAWASIEASNDKIPTVCYTVQPGDTLFEIAQKFQIPLSKLIKANNLKNNIIQPNDILIIPDKTNSSSISRGNVLRDDIMLLAKAIYAEARGESFTGQVAVGAVILNRVKSSNFPNTIREVIMQKNGHTVQFTPVADGTINLSPDETAIRAALEALKGVDPTGGALFFYNPEISSDRWITTLPVVTRIGNHVFATKA